MRSFSCEGAQIQLRMAESIVRRNEERDEKEIRSGRCTKGYREEEQICHQGLVHRV